MHSIAHAGRISGIKGITMGEEEALSLQLPAEEVTAPPSFSEAVATHQSLVFSIAYHLLHNASLAEEIAQEVFLRLYRDYHKIQSGSHLTYWLRRAATHRCLDFLRRSKRWRPVSLEKVELPLPATANDGDPILEQTLRRLVAGLPAGARAVVVLRFQEDLEPREIAHILDIPVNTVKSRLQRALAVLRRKLESSRGVAS
jgi:RNA polymerase sigma-70 factor (ECF subfamily)